VPALGKRSSWDGGPMKTIVPKEKRETEFNSSGALLIFKRGRGRGGKGKSSICAREKLGDPYEERKGARSQESLKD